MSEKPGVTRLDSTLEMSAWKTMEMVGDLSAAATPMERFHRVHETTITAPCKLRAGVWEAQAYSERLQNYPYDEIVFVVAGSISISDEHGHDEHFKAGDCFFLHKGFTGIWNQHENLKIFHMTVAAES